MDLNLDINYYKLNPYIMEELKISITELEKLIDHYRFNINSIENKNKTEYFEFILLSGLST